MQPLQHSNFGDELHYVFHCPCFAAVRAQYSNLFQDAGGSMRLFMWHEDQKAVSHCLTAILQMKLACELLARRVSGHVCPQSISCLLCATSLTGPDSRSSLCLQPSWTLERPMTACSTLSSGHPYSEREFMAKCLQPYSHCTAGVQ